MAECYLKYLTSFFMDSISIFFSSRGLIIDLTYIINRQLSLLTMTQTAHFKDLQHREEDHPSKQQEEYTERNHSGVYQENDKLKKMNLLLKNQLNLLSDSKQGKIRIKIDQKSFGKGKPDQASLMELQNAYKQCNIYKKQANFYRKKLITYEAREKSHEMYEWKTNQLEKQNSKLREEIKYLMKINKKQEKGLQSAGLDSFLGNTKEIDKLQEEIRRLKKQISVYEKQSLKKIESCDYHTQINQFNTIHGAKEYRKKPQSRIRMHSQISEYETSQVIYLKQKLERESAKLRSTYAEKQKFRQHILQYKQEISIKNRQIEELKEKLASLRKRNSHLQTQISSKKQPKEENELTRYKRNKSNYILTDTRSLTIPKIQNKIRMKHIPPNKPDQNEVKTIKWTHQRYASRMKQIHISIHQQGHIKDIHARYQKGQPKRNSYPSYKTQSKSLVCRQGEYIRHISGCFCDDYLQCLAVFTSDKRFQTFGNSYLLELNQQCQKFEFSLESSDYIGMLSGQNTEKGVVKLDCSMIKQF